MCSKALKELQTEKPAYHSGADDWWGEVIRRTALGAGADRIGLGYILLMISMRVDQDHRKLLTRTSISLYLDY